MPDFGFGIQVNRAGPGGKESSISVEAPLDKFGLPGLVLKASRNRAPNVTGSRWPDGLAWSITDRLRNDGARKGRVLAIWQGDQVVAACAWHLHDSGPLVIFDLGCRTDVTRTTADRAATALLLCLRAIADAPGISRGANALRWSDRPLDRIASKSERNRARQAVRQRAATLAFTPLRPRPKWWKGRWAVERIF